MSVPLRHLPLLLIASVGLHNITWAQETIEEKEERFRQRSEKIESEELATPFGGITTNGKIVPGLFNIKSTGVSTEPVRRLIVPSSLTLMEAVDGPLPLRHSPREIPTPRPSSSFLGRPSRSFTACKVSTRPLRGKLAPPTDVSPSLMTFFIRKSNGSIPSWWAMLSMWDSTAKCRSATPEAR